PGDRTWAVAHEAAKVTPKDPKWAPCANFHIGAKAPQLQAVRAHLDEATGRVTLTHPELDEITVAPDDPADAARLVDWLGPISPPERARPAFVYRAGDRGMTDTEYPSISLAGLGSHRAVEGRLGRTLSPLRWRANFLVEGLAPWEEFEWLGKRIRLGTAVLEVRERIRRCLATTVDPATGHRDADTLGLLQSAWGHRDFGVYAEVIEPGEVREGDPVEVIS
ncbi:MAG: MOSC domain-containing protein, partial [Alphaproteobacteria bacterium]